MFRILTILAISLTLFSALATSSPPSVEIIPANEEQGKELDGTNIPLTDHLPEFARLEDATPIAASTQGDSQIDETVGMALTPDDAAESTSTTGNGDYLDMERDIPRESNLVLNWINALLVLCGVMAFVISSR